MWHWTGKSGIFLCKITNIKFSVSCIHVEIAWNQEPESGKNVSECFFLFFFIFFSRWTVCIMISRTEPRIIPTPFIGTYLQKFRAKIRPSAFMFGDSLEYRRTYRMPELYLQEIVNACFFSVVSYMRIFHSSSNFKWIDRTVPCCCCFFSLMWHSTSSWKLMMNS